jgi:hypothetical protein
MGVCLVSQEKGDACYGGASCISGKGRHALWGCISYLKKKETHVIGVRLVSQEKGDARYGGVSPFYLTPQKRLSTEYSPWDAPCASMQRAHWHTYVHVCVPTSTYGPGARRTTWSTSCLRSSKPLDCRVFKSR